MKFKQWKQVIGLQEPPKTQTRRLKFSYELARQLWKHGWMPYDQPQEPWTYAEWMRDFPPTDEQLAEANRILAENVITLPVLPPGRGEKSKGRVRVKRVWQERPGDISEKDCMAEGIRAQEGDGLGPGPGLKWIGLGYQDPVTGGYHVNIPPIRNDDAYSQLCTCHIGMELQLPAWQCAFRSLWNNVYGPGAWDRMKDDNVYAFEFEHWTDEQHQNSPSHS